MTQFVSTHQAAVAAEITRQAFHKICKGFNEGRTSPWRNAVLQVRAVHGQGGHSGRRYEVALESLPPELKRRCNELYGIAEAPPSHVEAPINPSEKAASAASWWDQFLRPILAHPKASRDRAAAMKAAAAQRVSGPHGEWFMPSLRDIQRKVRAAEVGGLRALRRKRREVKPESRPVLTRRWDAVTAGLGRDAQAGIARKIKQHVRDLWGRGAAYSAVRRLASEHLADLTLKAGIGESFAQILPACELPKHLVEAGRSARRVHEHRTDIKSWDDKRPRVQLTSAGLAPMQLVYGDVHHFDVYVKREDGSLATPKGIAWLDAATRRLRIDLVLCEPGTGIRNSDLIESFMHMTQDQHWGMPARLYLDNGSEYNFADFIKDALKLTGLDCVDRSGPINRPGAYDAAVKGIIEGSFRVLEQTVLSPLQGYIGGDRMKTRTGNLGKAPEPFPGTFDDFCHDFKRLLVFYNTNRQAGDLRGRSPEQTYAQAVGDGWQRTDVNPMALMMAFSMEGTRKVQDGKISVDGQLFYCDELARHTGDRVRVQLPKYLHWPAVPVLTMKGELIGVAGPDPIFGRLDPAGAEEASRRKRVARAAIASEAADLNPIDVKEEMMASADRQPATPIPESKGTIELATAQAEIGRQIMETPAQKRDREHEAKQAKLLEALKRSTRFGALR